MLIVKIASLILMIAVTCQGSYLISACSLTCIIIVPRSYESRERRNGNIQTDPRFFVTGTGYECLCSDKNTGGARTVDSASISSRRLCPFVRVRFLASVYSAIRTANATRALAETIKTQHCPYICLHMLAFRLQIFLLRTHPPLSFDSPSLIRTLRKVKEKSFKIISYPQKDALEIVMEFSRENM